MLLALVRRRGCARRRAAGPRAAPARWRPRACARRPPGSCRRRRVGRRPAVEAAGVFDSAASPRARTSAMMRSHRRVDACVAIPTPTPAARRAGGQKSGSRVSSRGDIRHRLLSASVPFDLAARRHRAPQRLRSAPSPSGASSSMDALLTTRRELMSAMCSSGTRPFALRVLPVSTRSTMRSASPTSGASSIEPYSLITSTCMPWPRRAARGLDVLGGDAQAACPEGRILQRGRPPSSGSGQCAGRAARRGPRHRAPSARPCPPRPGRPRPTRT